MTYDGKLLAHARSILDAQRRAREEVFSRRQLEAYTKNPRIRELDAQLRGTMAELLAAALDKDASGQIEQIREKNLELQQARRREITKAGFADGYLNDDPCCFDCRDTGFINGIEPCECLIELYRQAQNAALSSLLKLGAETFETFRLDYYSDDPNANGVSPRRVMGIIFETCRQYANKFGSKSDNQLFTGAPGLGKTFLSACIARVVAEAGFSVVYDTAGAIFTKFEDAKFSREEEDRQEARRETKRMLECDLLIMDDLGTELVTAFTKSALYEIVNTRLITGKKTIISTNMSQEALRSNYTEQIVSRLEGEYKVQEFRGEDIRKKKS
ncbi:MAG: ATP-binding protein [Oscillospiraceae bacterium]|nr:ATP-binding protein [Oscillospiraceae bacterium]